MTKLIQDSNATIPGAALEPPMCPQCGAFTRFSYAEPDSAEARIVVCVYDCMCGGTLMRPYGARA